jgi:hypothetical protein
MPKRLQDLFISLVGKIESAATPISRYFLLFLAILAVRLTLEFFSSHRLFSLADVLHIGLWFALIVQAFLLQLHWFSGESIDKVVRLSVVGFTIALTAPVIDLVVSGGQGAKMNYLAINNWGDVFWAYVTAGGSSLTRGATLGIRIEIALLVVASANYIYTKRQRLLPALIGALSIYTVLFVSGTVPKLLGLIVDGFGLSYAPGDQSTLLFLLTLDLLMLLIAIGCHAPAAFVDKLRQLPFGFMAMGMAMVGFGAMLARANYPGNWMLNPSTLFHFPLLGGLALCFGMLIVLLHADEHTQDARNGSAILLLLIGFAIGERVMFGVAALWGLLFLYAEAPLRLGKVFLLRHLVVALACGMCALLGFIFLGAPMVGFPKTILLPLLAATFLISLGLEKHEDSGAAHAPLPFRLPGWVHSTAFYLGLSVPIGMGMQQASGVFSIAVAVGVAVFCGLYYMVRRFRLQWLLLLFAIGIAAFGASISVSW